MFQTLVSADNKEMFLFLNIFNTCSHFRKGGLAPKQAWLILGYKTSHLPQSTWGWVEEGRG
jgi:hypothetical protein